MPDLLHSQHSPLPQPDLDEVRKAVQSPGFRKIRESLSHLAASKVTEAANALARGEDGDTAEPLAAARRYQNAVDIMVELEQESLQLASVKITPAT